MEIKVLDVAGFREAIRAMRLPMKSGDKSDSWARIKSERTEFDFLIGPEDYDLSMKLIRAGSSHRKHIRLIDVWLEIQAPLYWWKEFDTYRIGVDKVSESTMHTITNEEITQEDFDLSAWDDNEFAREWIVNLCDELRLCGEFDRLNQLLPQSYLQTRIVKCSYEALRTMYHDRKNHKLKEWRQLCKALEDLPYSRFLTEPEFTSGYSPDDYLEEAMRTCSFADDEQDQLRHAVFGLASEAGEVAGILQKVYQGHDFDRDHLLKELGDCQFMIAEACDALHASLTDDVMKANIEKLKARYPDRFDPEKSLHRADGDI